MDKKKDKENTMFPLGIGYLSITMAQAKLKDDTRKELEIEFDIKLKNLKKQLKEELREELKDELREEIKKELKDELKKKIYEELKNDLYENDWNVVTRV